MSFDHLICQRNEASKLFALNSIKEIRLEGDLKKHYKNLKRREIHHLRAKIDFLKKSHEEKFQAKRTAIHQKRAEKLKRFRLNYMPLCLEEDLERYAKYFAEEAENE